MGTSIGVGLIGLGTVGSGVVQLLRDAFEKTAKDPAFLKEAKESKLIIDAVTGPQIEQFVAQILGMSKESKDALGFLVRKKKKK